jgi:hypothetical protein
MKSWIQIAVLICINYLKAVVLCSVNNSCLIAHHYWGISMPTVVFLIAQPILIEIMKGL